MVGFLFKKAIYLAEKKRKKERTEKNNQKKKKIQKTRKTKTQFICFVKKKKTIK